MSHYETGMIEDKINEFNDEFTDMVHKMNKVSADKLGLDIRAGYGLWVCEEGIVVTHAVDRTLQYYGGFEYVDKEDRTVIGNWVFYSRNSGRVQGCLDYYESEQETEIK